MEAWASHKSYLPRGEEPPLGGGSNRPRDFKGERRRRETHESTTDPEVRLYWKGPQQKARLCYHGHLLTENSLGLVVTPHIAQIERWRRRAIEGRTIRHPGYHRGQRQRRQVEEVFGWIKTVGAGGNRRRLGRARNKLWFELAAAYILTRLALLEAATAQRSHTEAA